MIAARRRVDDGALTCGGREPAAFWLAPGRRLTQATAVRRRWFAALWGWQRGPPCWLPRSACWLAGDGRKSAWLWRRAGAAPRGATATGPSGPGVATGSRFGPGLAGAIPSAPVLPLCVTMAVGPGVGLSFSRCCGGASGGAKALQVVVLRRWRVMLSQVRERAAGVVQ
jgi:hypothetical protein